MATLLPRPLHQHRQNTPTDCGRACAQMVIGYVLDGLKPPATPLVQQDALAKAEAGTNPGWETDPEELTTLINTEITTVSSDQWSLVQFPAGDPAAAVDSMLGEVRSTVDRGYPAVMSKSASDHWIVVWGYEYNPAGHLVLYQADPLAHGPNGARAVHSQTDLCPQAQHTIDVVLVGSEYFVVDAKPFDNRAIAIVVPQADFAELMRKVMRYVRIIPWWWWKVPPPPPPPKWIQPREVSIRIVMQGWYDAFAGLVHSLALYPFKEIVRTVEGRTGWVRYVRPARPGGTPFLLAAVLSSTETGVLIVFDHQGNIQSYTVTDASFVTCLEVDDSINAEDLVFVPRYGRYQPFEKTTDESGRAVLRRLHDGLIVPDEHP